MGNRKQESSSWFSKVFIFTTDLFFCNFYFANFLHETVAANIVLHEQLLCQKKPQYWMHFSWNVWMVLNSNFVFGFCFPLYALVAESSAVEGFWMQTLTLGKYWSAYRTVYLRLPRLGQWQYYVTKSIAVLIQSRSSKWSHGLGSNQMIHLGTLKYPISAGNKNIIYICINFQCNLYYSCVSIMCFVVYSPLSQSWHLVIARTSPCSFLGKIFRSGLSLPDS